MIYKFIVKIGKKRKIKYRNYEYWNQCYNKNDACYKYLSDSENIQIIFLMKNSSLNESIVFHEIISFFNIIVKYNIYCSKFYICLLLFYIALQHYTMYVLL